MITLAVPLTDVNTTNDGSKKDRSVSKRVVRRRTSPLGKRVRMSGSQEAYPMHRIKLPPAIATTFPVAKGLPLVEVDWTMGPSCGRQITPRDRVFLVETTSTKLGEEQNSTSTFHTISFSATRERRRWFVRSLRVLKAAPEKGASIRILECDKHCQEGGLSENADEYKQRQKDCSRYRDRETKGTPRSRTG